VSKIIATSAIDGAVAWVAQAEAKLAEAIGAKGADCPVAFPSTAYYLPIIHSLTGMKVQRLEEMREVIAEAKRLLPARPSESNWLPYLGNALDAGVAALFACEIIEACKYAIGPNPVDGIWLGAANDVILRERGVEFVDGSAPGFAAITGAAPTNAIAVRIARELQEKNLYVFMGGSTNGKQFADQLAEEGVQLGWETRLVPFGKDVSALVYALGFANRAALSFGGIKAGDSLGNLKYNKNRIFAFVLAFGEVTPEKYAIAAGAINYGFPVIADTAIPQILPTGVCTYEHVVSSVPYETMVERALEVRGCKVKVAKVPIPVAYGPAFAGERIRKVDVHAEFGGNITTAFEFVTSVEMDQIEDGVIEIIGPDIDAIEPGSALPLGIWVEAAGRKMQGDFEPILERQIHHLVNGAEGIWHMGQRDIVWTRVSKSGFQKGLRLRHYGEIIHAKLLADYPAIVDKVKVTLITDKDEVERRVAVARKIYDERNRRLESMTDESVDTFYSCLLCQSFAPDHVCIITPERLGLCGAYNWLDGKAAFEIDETGPNQPVRKGETLDPVQGVWKDVNDFVFINSHKAVKQFNAYSIMNNPMTSCGCFEVICAYVPEANGIMAVNREYQGDTPIGMTFSSLAGSVGGGQQTPGFMGCGKIFLTSRKFLYADGGIGRLVWMPKELKAILEEDLKKRFAEAGLEGAFDKIADETDAIEASDLRAYLEKMEHPALSMPDIANLGGGDASAESSGAEHQVAAAVEAKAAELGGESREGGVATVFPPSAPTEELIRQIKEQIKAEIANELRPAVAREIVGDIIDSLRMKFLGEKPAEKDAIPGPAPVGATPVGATPVVKTPVGATPVGATPVVKTPVVKTPVVKTGLTAAQRFAGITAFVPRKETAECPIWTVKLGATKAEGGTRGRTFSVGGQTGMPFHHWEGSMPNRPLVAMEVFDVVSEKYPDVLRKMYGELLSDPARMAKICVEKYGADLISVRLEGSHPEKGDRSPDDEVKLVKSVLQAVDVPLIITGHSHYEKINEVMKAVAQGCEGENLLLSWVEQDNYRSIAGSAMAYGHSIVSQSPIDVNIGKQLNILLGNMDFKQERIVMDPMTGATGYGIEYSYSVMERIRLTALGGDRMLAGPLIVSPGQESAKIKESKALEADFPEWGSLSRRAALWELGTAMGLLQAGADILIMYNPEAAVALRKSIDRLMAN
jgi:acetyl-CoA synthase